MDISNPLKGMASASNNRRTSSFQIPKKQKAVIEDKKFNMDSEDFPSLTEILKADVTKNKQTLNMSKMSFSYSGKLRTQHQQNPTLSLQVDENKSHESKNSKVASQNPNRKSALTSPTSGFRSEHRETTAKDGVTHSSSFKKDKPPDIEKKDFSLSDSKEQFEIEETSDWITVSRHSKSNQTLQKPKNSSTSTSTPGSCGNFMKAKQSDMKRNPDAHLNVETLPFTPCSGNVPRPIRGFRPPLHSKESDTTEGKKEINKSKAQSESTSVSKPDNADAFLAEKCNKLNLHHVSQNDVLVATKKNRKSRRKRQAALQSKKLSVLTPETHLKILGLSSKGNFKNCKSVLNDFNDAEEYPELGAVVEQKSKRKVGAKIEEIISSNSDEKDTESEKCSYPSKDGSHQEVKTVPTDTTGNEERQIDKEKKHVGDPITMSLFDMIRSAKVKRREHDSHAEQADDGKHPTKGLTKKIVAPAVNPLASSRPTVKRGKEREKPKVKKPSRMKKLILLERQERRQNAFAKLLNSDLVRPDGDGTDLTNCEMHELDRLEEIVSTIASLDADMVNTMQSSETSTLGDEFCSTLSESDRKLISKYCGLIDTDDIAECSEDNQESPNECIDSDTNLSTEYKCLSELELPETQGFTNAESVSEVSMEVTKSAETTDDNVDFTKDVTDISQFCEPCNSLQDSVSSCPEKSIDFTQPEVPALDINCSPTNEPVQKQFSEEDKMIAAKLLIHTRKFRQYCNHFVSQELDETVFSLIDDLARFQDRLHQKDPVKARIRRRLIYGIKEIKRHMKVKKLKCIIIATDIEDIKAEGGLNDTLEELKSLSETYQVPCVFSHRRYGLGKVCRKSVPVSCVGVFNYEGSEKNFKKMIQLKEEIKHEYSELTKKLSSDLTDARIVEIFHAERTSVDNLRTASQKILKEFYLLNLAQKSESCPPEDSPVPNNDETSVGNSQSMEGAESNLFSLSEDSDLSAGCENFSRAVAFVQSLDDEPENLIIRRKVNMCDIMCKYKVLKD